MLKQENWARVDELFDAALDKPPRDRSAWLREACGGDETLRAEVEKLLRLADDDADRGAASLSGRLEGELWHDVLRDLGTSEEERLTPGDHLQGYEILGLLGKGGMGSVYRARDEDLGREVAIKALSKIYVPDPPSQRRFQREAKLLASLNHPNIGAIYDLIIDDGYPYLVLELVEGETLSERLQRGPLPLEEVLAIAAELLDAIEEAHRKGIVHRDLKPGNVKLAPGGRVKVLDFGLAKSRVGDEAASGKGSEDAETTQTGMVLGTPAYMSPEQARGDNVDERTDLWAFGCLLYEMLTGTKAFRGESTSEVLAAVLRDDVDYRLLPASTPAELGRLIRRCLTKDPRARLSQVSEARAELANLTVGRFRAGGPKPMGGRRIGLGLAALAGALVIALALFTLLRESRPLRLTNPVQITSSADRDDLPSWSPDGRALAYASLRGSDWNVWIVPAEGGDPVNRTGDHEGIDFTPSWSPDGREIAFRSDRDGGGIFLMPSVSGAPRKVVSDPEASSLWAVPAWSPDGSRLLYTVLDRDRGRGHRLEIVSLASGRVESFDVERRWNCICELALSPGGRFLAYVDAQEPTSQISQLWLYRFEDGRSLRLTDDRTREASPTWAATERSLYFVSNRGGSMDLWRLALEDDGRASGEPERVTVGIGMERARFSRDGSKLAYSQGRRVANLYRAPILSERRARWTDVEQLTFDQAFVEFVDAAPDGTKVVVSSDRAGNPDLWSLPASGGSLTRLTSDPTPDWLPAYSPDGTQIAFYAYRSGNRDLWVMPAEGGAARRVTFEESSDASPGWTHDGKGLMFYSNRGGNVDLWVVPVSGGEATRLVESEGIDRFARASPDGAWIAFTSFGGGESALWRIPAQGGEKRLVLKGLATYFAWARDGKSLFFTPRRALGDNIWRVAVEGGEPEPITDLTGRRGRLGRVALAVGPHWVYFTWEEDLGDIWTMEVVR